MFICASYIASLVRHMSSYNLLRSSKIVTIYQLLPAIVKTWQERWFILCLWFCTAQRVHGVQIIFLPVVCVEVSTISLSESLAEMCGCRVFFLRRSDVCNFECFSEKFHSDHQAPNLDSRNIAAGRRFWSSAADGGRTARACVTCFGGRVVSGKLDVSSFTPQENWHGT